MGRVYDRRDAARIDSGRAALSVRSTAAEGRATALLESLVAIPSVTGEEAEIVDFLDARFRRAGWIVEPIPVSRGRGDLFIHHGRPRVVLTTHADTVPPYFPPRREGGTLFARGACDAKGSLAAMVVALEELSEEDAGLLVVVGEERGSDGARAANAHPQDVRYLVGGEPTGNRFVAGSKGCLRVALETRGVAGHSSIPSAQGARSAVDPLLDVLQELRRLTFPVDPLFGRTTMNVGLLEAGSAPNVVAERGRAEVLFRTGIPVAAVLERVRQAARGLAEVTVPYRSDPIAFATPRGETPDGGIVSFACDLPLLDSWGVPILIGPGSIEHAHSAQERVELAQVEDAVPLYQKLVSGLLASGDGVLEAYGRGKSRVPSA
jgi:acetylornithine deacetylase